MSSVIPYIFMITFSSLSTVNKLISTSEKQDPVVRKWLYTTCYAIINICSKSEKILFFFRRKNKLSKREKKKKKKRLTWLIFIGGRGKKIQLSYSIIFCLEYKSILLIQNTNRSDELHTVILWRNICGCQREQILNHTSWAHLYIWNKPFLKTQEQC